MSKKEKANKGAAKNGAENEVENESGVVGVDLGTDEDDTGGVDKEVAPVVHKASMSEDPLREKIKLICSTAAIIYSSKMNNSAANPEKARLVAVNEAKSIIELAEKSFE